MTEAKVLRIYLAKPMLDDARAGRVNVLNRIANAFARSGFRTEYCQDTEQERLRSLSRRGYSLFHMREPLNSQTLCLRLSYLYPFWRIEDTNERWSWDIAKAEFHPDEIDPKPAQGFIDRRRAALFGDAQVVDHDFVLVALQGRLLHCRSFQSMSPIEMIRAVLEADPKRDVVLRPHPREQLDENEKRELHALVDKTPRLRIVRRPLEDMLPRCSYVVTQNSSTALKGFFAQKPAVLFAKTDFHHISASVLRDGVDEAFRHLRDAPYPDYARYLQWFFHTYMVDGANPNAEEQVLERVRRFGWEV